MKSTGQLFIPFIFTLLSFPSNAIPDQVHGSPVDFVHYKARLTPSFSEKSVQGSLEIEFIAIKDKISQLTFSAKYKRIFDVSSPQIALSHKTVNDQLVIRFDKPLVSGNSYHLTIGYQAKPERGMKFYPDHLFTVYHTNYWMLAHNNINDKASFELFLTHNKALTSQSNGTRLSVTPTTNNQVISHWRQTKPMPIYTLGFALGKFERIDKGFNDSAVSFLFRPEPLSGLDSAKVNKIFADVPDMIRFFEQKSGVTLPDNQYNYVLVQGSIAQEAAGYSLVGEKFGHTVLSDEHENWFIAHELAHQWWGNSITCANFSHFWLNEGLVQFLVAAYKEHLFGEDAYKKEIALAMARVDRAVKKGRNAPVAFSHQIGENEINQHNLNGRAYS